MTTEKVLSYFKEITRIPRESGHEEHIIAYLQEFAATHELACKTDAAGNVYGYTLCNSMFADRNYDAGSGDLMPDDYVLTISLKDFVATTKLLGGTAFPAEAYADGKLTFAGIQVYSVNGAEATAEAPVLTAGESEVVEEEEEKPVTPPTGDASLLVFVLIGLVSLAGVSFAAKAHKEF